MATRRRIRWDRISVAAVVLVLIILLFGAFIRGCADKEPLGTMSESDTTGTPTPDTTAAPAEGSPELTAAPPVTTPGATAATTVNVPVIITDGPPADPVTTTSTTQPEETAGTPITTTTLPAGYTTNRLSDQSIYSGTLILVNNEIPCRLSNDELALQQVYYAEDKPETYEISYPGYTSLNKTALTQFNRLMKSYFAATSNTEVMFNYGYLGAGKEKSLPESPTALDIQLHIKRNDGGYEYVTNITPYSWLFEHMASYGFILRYPNSKGDITGTRLQSEYTAIRYVGVPHAAYMRENDLCLEEYLEQLRTGYNFYDGKMLSYSTPELSYHIYYVPVASDADETDVPVPSTGSYEISGNNTDGFIVTAIVG